MEGHQRKEFPLQFASCGSFPSAFFSLPFSSSFPLRILLSFF